MAAATAHNYACVILCRGCSAKVTNTTTTDKKNKTKKEFREHKQNIKYKINSCAVLK